MKHYKNIIFLLCVGCLLTGVWGCGPKKPEGFPSVFPCSITVLNPDGKPEDRVIVLLTPVESAAFHNISTSGSTKANGVAIIGTFYPNYAVAGVPAGEYVVSLSKEAASEDAKSLDEIKKMSADDLDEYRKQMERAKKTKSVIPVPLQESITSPLRVTVGTEGSLTVNLKDYPDVGDKQR